jgi:hypothetical protein
VKYFDYLYFRPTKASKIKKMLEFFKEIMFNITKTNRLLVGMNTQSKTFHDLNGLIPLGS